MMQSEKEKAIVGTVKNITFELNKQLILAAKNDIEVRFEDVHVTQMGDKVSRIQVAVKLFKAL